MDPEQLSKFLAKKGFSVKQVPLMNTLGKLGKDGVNTFDLTANSCDKYIGSEFFTCSHCSKMFSSRPALCNHVEAEHSSGRRRLLDGEPPTPDDDDDGETSYIIIRTDPDASIFGSKKNRGRRVETKPRKPYEKRSNAPLEINGPFRCSVCDEHFAECCLFSMHMNTEHFKRRRLILRCQICEKRFAGFNGNNNPEVPAAEPSDRLSCDVCGRTFPLQAHLDYHQKKHHSAIKPYECSLCSKSFSLVTGLTQHMKTHSGNRPFVCTVCSKAFRQKAGLDQHARIHNKVKPYQCLICGRAFTQSAHLSQHMRIHTKIEPFECNVCFRRFKQSSHLNFHLKSHAGGMDSLGNGGEINPIEDYDSGITITPLNHSLQLINNLCTTSDVSQ